MKLLDFLLFPKSLYQKLTVKKQMLFLGILLVGISDIVFRLSIDKFGVFTGRTQETLKYNIVIFIFIILILGFLDVLFFSLPLSDLFKLFKTEKLIDKVTEKGTEKEAEKGIQDKKMASIIIMKIYSIAHLIIVPIQVFIYLVILKNVENSAILFVAGLLDITLPLWFSAAITRGINAVYNFQPIFKRLIFAIVILWSYVLGYVFSFAVDRWIIKLFR